MPRRQRHCPESSGWQTHTRNLSATRPSSRSKHSSRAARHHAALPTSRGSVVGLPGAAEGVNPSRTDQEFHSCTFVSHTARVIALHSICVLPEAHTCLCARIECSATSASLSIHADPSGDCYHHMSLNPTCRSTSAKPCPPSSFTMPANAAGATGSTASTSTNTC